MIPSPGKLLKPIKKNAEQHLIFVFRQFSLSAEIFQPGIPFSSEKIFKMLNAKPVTWDKSGKENLAEGHQLNKPEIIFPKIEDEMIEEQTSKLNDKPQETEDKERRNNYY